jgi:hypothetical protein
LRPHLSKYWKIPPDGCAAFVARMEDVLEVYQLPHDPDFPMVCSDESEVHASCHPHGRLDETQDIYGRLSIPDAPQQDLPSPGAGEPIEIEAVMVTATPALDVPAAPVTAANARRP